jgi:hypothetical protein
MRCGFNRYLWSGIGNNSSTVSRPRDTEGRPTVGDGSFVREASPSQIRQSSREATKLGPIEQHFLR